MVISPEDVTMGNPQPSPKASFVEAIGCSSETRRQWVREKTLA
jgi:hypothetical protein